MSDEGIEHAKKLGEAKHAYVGIKPCGCCVAAVVDTGDKFTGKAVSEFIRSGLKIERQPMEWVRQHLYKCTHKEATGNEPDLFEGRSEP